MDETDLEALRGDLQRLPVPAVITDLTTQKIVAVNAAAAALFGASATELVGTDVISRLHPSDRAASLAGAAALEDHIVDGFQATRRIVRPDGSERSVNVWGRRIAAQGGLLGLWVPLYDSETAAMALVGSRSRPTDVVIALTDHDWQLAYVSTGARLIGGADLVGTPLLGLVHPSAAADFLAASSRAVASHLAITVTTRFRSGQNQWTDRTCVVVSMCEHDPPRLGIAIAPIEWPAHGDALRRSLAPDVRHAALDARATHALDAAAAASAHRRRPQLSARQLEVLALLIDGESVDGIARNLYLSASTVRNHLTLIYRKFGVHSQAELLAALLRATSSDGG